MSIRNSWAAPAAATIAVLVAACGGAGAAVPGRYPASSGSFAGVDHLDLTPA